MVSIRTKSRIRRLEFLEGKSAADRLTSFVSGKGIMPFISGGLRNLITNPSRFFACVLGIKNWREKLWLDFDSYEAGRRAESKLKEMGYALGAYDTGGSGVHIGVAH